MDDAKLMARLRELSRAVVEYDMEQFRLRIPLNPERCADIVLCNAANRLDELTAQLAEKERELTDWQEGFKEMAEVMQCLSGHDLTDEQTQTVFGVLDSYLPPRTGE